VCTGDHGCRGSNGGNNFARNQLGLVLVRCRNAVVLGAQVRACGDEVDVKVAADFQEQGAGFYMVQVSGFDDESALRVSSRAVRLSSQNITPTCHARTRTWNRPLHP
jgi:hypothetical protein